ncbi:MAG: DUF2066 domain-containing protein [Gammaproteobacteria bacterium]|nr:DUF2066 domain-containing protein [Gammaproteobacteria bacterium]
MRLSIRQLSGYMCLILAIFFISTASVNAAVRVDGLYEVEVPVSNQARQERKRALRKGLADLITRLTGSVALEEFGQFMDVLDRTSAYVEQYRYHSSINPDAKAGQKPDLVLWVRFNRKAIQKLLRDQQLPLWGSTRPETLIWIAIQNQDNRQLMSADEESSFYRSVLTNARRRGVPVLVPLFDLEDQQNVSVADVWGGFTGVIKSASARYATENILVGRVFPSADGWESRWTLISETDEQHWSGSGKNIDSVVAAGFNGLGDLMASRYALESTYDASQYYLKISAIDSLQAYAKANQYLKNVSAITRFNPVYFAQGNVTYVIEINGTVEGLEQVFRLERRLLVDDEVIPVQPVVQAEEDINKKVLTEETPLIKILDYRLKL